MQPSHPFDNPAKRVETDSFGPVEVPAGVYWGAQTARSLLREACVELGLLSADEFYRLVRPETMTGPG
jgi:fumarate hydratase class II